MALVVALLVAFLGGSIVSLISGENPFHVYSLLLTGSFGSFSNIGYTLFYATPFIFSGLAVAIPYRTQLFNIGGEGQFMIAGVGLYAVAIHTHSLPLAILAAIAGGALWAGIAGAAKAWKGSHEVITTIMLNFIAAGILSYFVLYQWKDPSSQNAETLVLDSSLWIAKLGFGRSPLNFCFFIAIFSAFFAWVFLEKTKWGFKLRAVGLNPSAAKTARFSVARAQVLSMMIGGGCAAGVALNEILGNTHRLRDGFSAGYGFVGIAVAFLGKTSPLGVVLAALFFGALAKGSGELELETANITRDFSVVMQAILIAAVAIEPTISRWFERRRIQKKATSS